MEALVNINGVNIEFRTEPGFVPHIAYATFKAVYEKNDNYEAVRLAVKKAVTDFVLADGRTAKISYGETGLFGGAIVTGFVADITLYAKE